MAWEVEWADLSGVKGVGTANPGGSLDPLLADVRVLGTPAFLLAVLLPPFSSFFPLSVFLPDGPCLGVPPEKTTYETFLEVVYSLSDSTSSSLHQ